MLSRCSNFRAAGTAILGMWLLGEPRTALRIGCIVVIIAGVIGLKVGG